MFYVEIPLYVYDGPRDALILCLIFGVKDFYEFKLFVLRLSGYNIPIIGLI